METTSALLKRTAQQVVTDLDPVKAVVLFGSRARGTARAGSDWDIAVLLDREPDAAIRSAVPVLEHVNVLYKNRNAINERARVAGSVESAIVRDGRVLAGEWKRPNQCRAPVVDNEIVEGHLTMASCGVVDAIHHSCSFLGGVHGVLKLVSRNAQSAAEFTSKAAMLHLGIDPTHVHDLIRLANQMEREKPHDPRAAKWAATVRSMNGFSGDRHTAVYEPTPLELLERPFAIVGTATGFFAEVLRDITETRGSFAPHAAAIAVAVEGQSLYMRGYADWALIPDKVRVRLDTWAEAVQSISRLAQSRP